MVRDGKWYAENACQWIKANQDDWKALKRLVHMAADTGGPVQQGDVAIMAREAGIEFSNVPDFKRDRNLWPALARYMVMQSPRLAGSLSFSKSKLDDTDMVSVWRETVSAGTFFAANDRFEAKELFDLGDASAA